MSENAHERSGAAPLSPQPNGFREGTGEALPHPDLGPLPQDWQVVRLGEVARFEGRFRRKELKQLSEIPFLPMALIPDDSLYITKWELRKPEAISSGIPIYEGDLLLAKITPCLENGKQGIVINLPNGWGFATTEVIPIRTSEMLMPEFLALYLKQPTIRKELADKMEGTTGRQRLPKSVVYTISIPLPPLAEQRAIAHVLTSIQRAIEATEQVIAAARELKKSLMRHLFAYGPVTPAAAESVPLQETEIGPLPAHWQVVRMGEVAVKTKQVDPRKNPSSVFKYIDVSSISREQLAITNYAEYVGAQAPHRARKAVKEGDIIFATVRPYLKRVALVDHQFDGEIVSTAFCVIRCNFDKVLSNYIFQVVIQDDFVERVAQHQRGSSYPAVIDKDVLRQTIPLPPLAEQRAIADMLGAVDAKIRAEEGRKAALQSLFHTMLHHLMTGKVRLPREFIAGFKESA